MDNTIDSATLGVPVLQPFKLCFPIPVVSILLYLFPAVPKNPIPIMMGGGSQLFPQKDV